mmetsp:Transcript_105823/g.268892  ORF Transcript_105823/g.268892 Transcript_105823/m.268892 type:complete len:370 (-) Transcript_105823:637-1746(-)
MCPLFGGPAVGTGDGPRSANAPHGGPPTGLALDLVPLVLPAERPEEVPAEAVGAIVLADPGPIVCVRQLLDVRLSELLHALRIAEKRHQHLQVLLVVAPHHDQVAVHENEVAEYKRVHIVAEPLHQPFSIDVLLLPVRPHHRQPVQEALQELLRLLRRFRGAIQEVHHSCEHGLVELVASTPGAAQRKGGGCQSFGVHARHFRLDTPVEDVEHLFVLVRPCEPRRVAPVHLVTQHRQGDAPDVRGGVPQRRQLVAEHTCGLPSVVLAQDLLDDRFEDRVVTVAELAVSTADAGGPWSVELPLGDNRMQALPANSMKNVNFDRAKTGHARQQQQAVLDVEVLEILEDPVLQLVEELRRIGTQIRGARACP